MKWSTKCCVLILAATMISLTLRVPRLAQRPLHCDEAVHADKFGMLLEKGLYEYDPNEYHGPTLNYLTLIPAWLGSVTTLSDASEFTIRIVPVFFGVAIVLMLLLVTDAMGPKPAALAALLTAISPAMVFYSRYYIMEMLLVCFTFGAIVSGYRYCRSKRVSWAISTGVFLGLMHASKETCVIAYGAMFLSLLLVILLNREERGIAGVLKQIKPSHIMLGLAAAVIISVLFFSSFTTHPKGVVDSIRTYTTYLDRTHNNGIHDHAWHYYLSMLMFFRFGSGPIWTEGIIVLLSVIGFLAAVTGKRIGQSNVSFLRFVAFYTLLMTVIYSLIPYKTPWCALGFLHGMILLAGVGAVTLVGLAPNVLPRLVITFLLFEACIHLCWQAYLASYEFSSDSRNPYVYAHSTDDVFEVGRLVGQYAPAHPLGSAVPIIVVCAKDDYWPLPWYLRSYSDVKYYDTVPENAADASIILVSSQYEGELARRLLELTPPKKRRMYMHLFADPYYIWLRPGIKLSGFVTRQLRDMYSQQVAPEMLSQDDELRQ